MNTNRETDQKKESQPLKPDRETLHTTDPQENMQGPISSPIKETGEAFDSKESREDADKRKDSRI